MALPALTSKIVSGLSTREWMLSAGITVAAFLGLGTLTALWANPWFIRMTPVSALDFVILGLEAPLLGLFIGIRSAACGIGQASVGGVLGFLGFGCSICNQVLMLVFGASVLLTYFEPVRYLVGLVGLGVLALALYRKLAVRALGVP